MKRKIHAGVTAAGVILLLAGLWYAVVKAGIPYQDPTMEMLEQYNRDMQTGNLLIIIGGVVVLAEAVYRVVRVLRRWFG